MALAGPLATPRTASPRLQAAGTPAAAAPACFDAPSGAAQLLPLFATPATAEAPLSFSAVPPLCMAQRPRVRRPRAALPADGAAPIPAIPPHMQGSSYWPELDAAPRRAAAPPVFASDNAADDDVFDDDEEAPPTLSMRRLSIELGPQELERILAIHARAMASQQLSTIADDECDDSGEGTGAARPGPIAHGGSRTEPGEEETPPPPRRRRPVLSAPLPQPRLLSLLRNEGCLAVASAQAPAPAPTPAPMPHMPLLTLPSMPATPHSDNSPRRRASLEDHWPMPPPPPLGACSLSEPSTPLDDSASFAAFCEPAADLECQPLGAHPPKRRRSSGGGRHPEFLVAVRRLLDEQHPCLQYYEPGEPDFFVADPRALTEEWNRCAGSSKTKKKGDDGNNGVHSLMCYYARVGKLIATKRPFGKRSKNVYRFPSDDE